MSFTTVTSNKQTHLDPKLTLFSYKNIATICKQLVILGIFLFIYYIVVSNNHLIQPPHYLAKIGQKPNNFDNGVEINNTNISHIAVGIASTLASWKFRKPYIESWWQPNVTKGYIFLDQDPSKFGPWPNNSSPPYKIYENISRYDPYNKRTFKHAIRIVRVIVETFRVLHEGIRWYIMVDDDTILFIDNLVKVLAKYDHRKYFYIGDTSETIKSNIDFSYKMAFGGGGYAISYPLAEALAKNMDICIKRYPFVGGSDHLMQSCVADLGVSLTQNKGFHQVDLHGDLSGYLSSHPQTPIISLHHFDGFDPIFPNMGRLDGLNHLMKAAMADESRLLQQTICYDKSKNWSYSIAWGYTTHLYKKFIPSSILQKPLETFFPWRKPSKDPYMFNARLLPKNSPCEMPHVFYLNSIKNDTKNDSDHIVLSYIRRSKRNLPLCFPSPLPSSSSGDHPTLDPNDIVKVIVLSPITKYNVEVGARRECCDVLHQNQKNITVIKYRSCMKNEIVGVD